MTNTIDRATLNQYRVSILDDTIDNLDELLKTIADTFSICSECETRRWDDFGAHKAVESLEATRQRMITMRRTWAEEDNA